MNFAGVERVGRRMMAELEPLRARLELLETENKALREQLANQGGE